MSKINRIYNNVIIGSVIIIILSILDLIFNIVNIPNEVLCAIIIFTCIGCISFIIDKIDYNKKNI